MEWWLFIAVICAGVSSVVAKNKGRSEFGWGLSAFIIGPLVLLVALLPPVANGKTTKNCPFCSEVIKYNAKICKYCNSQLITVIPKSNNNKVVSCPQCGNTDLRYNINDGGKSGWSCPICNK
ncbi:MAG TPA: hypothetical protein DCR81_05430 [Smithella sp.]|jgi:hypothetical protein|nr:hypothetical protein [Smithella sp.]